MKLAFAIAIEDQLLAADITRDEIIGVGQFRCMTKE
tara:strand:- start:2513 stop:2620 length:108 start_codon:yes stop_codon:yes gene_type:complete